MGAGSLDGKHYNSYPDCLHSSKLGGAASACALMVAGHYDLSLSTSGLPQCALYSAWLFIVIVLVELLIVNKHGCRKTNH